MTVHPNSLKNLVKFQSRGVANPKGRGASLSIKSELKKVLASTLEDENPLTKIKEKLPIKQWLVLKLVVLALCGDLNAIKEILDRVDGQVTKKIELDGIIDIPISQEVSFDVLKLEIQDELKKVKTQLGINKQGYSTKNLLTKKPSKSKK